MDLNVSNLTVNWMEQKNRPYYVIKNVRNVKRSNPKDCSLILKRKV